MKILDQLWGLFSRKRSVDACALAIEPMPLREFIYLDELSLRSLLSSQKGHLSESSSNQEAYGFEAGTTGTANVSIPTVANLTASSNFKTSNSNTRQTMSKATSQSWFRDFHKIADLKLIEPQGDVEAFASTFDLIGCDKNSVAIPSTKLERGSLVEFRVCLTGDPVYHLSTLASEFAGMAGDAKELFDSSDVSSALKEILPINKVLQRLLAGLIPFRAEALDYYAVEIDGTEYIVHKDAVQNLALQTKPIQLVGVTELEAYWKDIRRVLFSDGHFTMLCRVSRLGLHDTWTPVKLADLFQKIAPKLNEQISDAGILAFSDNAPAKKTDVNVDRLGLSLEYFLAKVVQDWAVTFEQSETRYFQELILDLKYRAGSVSDQKSAFSKLRFEIEHKFDRKLEDETFAAYRMESRNQSQLSMFPAMSITVAPSQEESISPDATVSPRLLDVEVVAIYW